MISVYVKMFHVLLFAASAIEWKTRVIFILEVEELRQTEREELSE